MHIHTSLLVEFSFASFIAPDQIYLLFRSLSSPQTSSPTSSSVRRQLHTKTDTNIKAIQMFLQNIKISKLLSCLRTKPKNRVLLLLSFKHRSQICRKTRFLCKTNCSYANLAQIPCVYYTHIIQDWYDRMHLNLRLGSVSLSRCLSLSFVSLSWSVKSVAKTDQLGQLPSQAKQH